MQDRIVAEAVDERETPWTPGPWVVVADETASQIKGYPCVYADGYTVIGTEGMYGDINQDFANAHLIAASPTMADYIQRKADEGCAEAASIIALARGEA